MARKVPRGGARDKRQPGPVPAVPRGRPVDGGGRLEKRRDVNASLPDQDPGSTAPPPAELLEQVYGELRALATRRLASEPPGQTLQATALVHEAWLRLGAGEGGPWRDQAHFHAAAARAMRRILIDQARRKQAVRHGGAWLRVELPDGEALPGPHEGEPEGGDPVERVDAAIEHLAKSHPERAELVRLRFYTGLTIVEAAASLGISPATAKRHWTFARAWLFRELTRGTRTR